MPSFRSRLDDALDVNDVSKKTVCTWYLALFYIVLVVYIFQLIGLIAVSPSLRYSFNVVLPVVIVDVFVLANLYFYYAMCSKLPEGFVATAIESAKTKKTK